MERYKQSFQFTGIIITLFSIMPFLGGLFDMEIIQILTFGVFPCLWWFAYDCLKKSRKGSFAFSWSLVIMVCCGLLYLLYEIRMFVIENSGFEERGTGNGSPLAFWMYLVFILIAFCGFFTVAWFGYGVLQEKKKLPLDNEQKDI